MGTLQEFVLIIWSRHSHCRCLLSIYLNYNPILAPHWHVEMFIVLWLLQFCIITMTTQKSWRRKVWRTKVSPWAIVPTSPTRMSLLFGAIWYSMLISRTHEMNMLPVWIYVSSWTTYCGVLGNICNQECLLKIYLRNDVLKIMTK